MSLIADNRIAGRIDSQNKVLIAKNADPRLVAFRKVLSAARGGVARSQPTRARRLWECAARL